MINQGKMLGFFLHHFQQHLTDISYREFLSKTEGDMLGFVRLAPSGIPDLQGGNSLT